MLLRSLSLCARILFARPRKRLIVCGFLTDPKIIMTPPPSLRKRGRERIKMVKKNIKICYMVQKLQALGKIAMQVACFSKLYT